MAGYQHSGIFGRILFLISLLLKITSGYVLNVTSIQLVTYNTGLTPKVEKYETRRTKIGDALNQLDSDVLCLQEVWFHSDMKRILEETNSRYPFSFSDMHAEVGQLQHVSHNHAPCMSREFLLSFLPCILAKCFHVKGTIDFLTCAKEKCKMLEILEQECITCLVLSEPDNIPQSCVADVGNRFNIPGLLMLSRRPIRNAHVTRFVPDRKLLLPRSFITARVDGVGTIACTHATANLGPIYFEDLPYNNWEEQNLEEARILVQYVGPAERAVIMGDLNSSPPAEQSGVKADMQGAYNYIRSMGYKSSYMTSPGICTWCTYNPLAHAQKNMVLDHILTKNITVFGARRILDENIQCEDFPLSDHFGIELFIQEP